MEGMQYGGGSGAGQYAEALSAKTIRMPTLAERMDMAIKDAEDRLRDLKESREILNANPQIEKLLDIMQKGRF